MKANPHLEPEDAKAEAQIATEKELIGSLILDPRMIDEPAVQALRPTDLIDPALGMLLVVLRRMQAEGRPIDAITLRAFIAALGLQGETGGAAFPVKLFNAVCTASNAAYNADVLREAALRRELSAVGLELSAQASKGNPLEVAGQWIERLRNIQEGSSDNCIKLLSMAELCDGDFELEYHIPNVLAKGQPALIAASYKAMKTSSALDLALSVATGSEFLGKFRTNRAPVVMFSGESGLGTLKETALRICDAKAINLREVDGFNLTDFLPRFDNRRHVAELRRLLKPHAGGIGIFDPAYLIFNGDDAANVAKQGEQLAPLRDIAAECGITPILVHHMRKTIDSYDVPELGWVAGAGYAEFARQWILLNRREKYEVGSGQHHLWMAYGGSAGHSGAWGVDITEGTRETIGGRIWNVRIAPVDMIRQEQGRDKLLAKETKQYEARRAKEARYQEQVLDVLASAPEPLTVSKIADTAGLNKTNSKDTALTLVELGKVDPVKVTINGREFDAYKLSTGQQRTAPVKPLLSRGGSTGQQQGLYIEDPLSRAQTD